AVGCWHYNVSLCFCEFFICKSMNCGYFGFWDVCNTSINFSDIQNSLQIVNRTGWLCKWTSIKSKNKGRNTMFAPDDVK
ncbi:MAG: hypothetical protein Q4A60_09090, partial [Pasteurellaceae bacterium]|nr:hypothetical protein [Pasteurellaceae bacterium]